MAYFSAVILKIHANNSVDFNNFVGFLDVGLNCSQFILFLIRLINATWAYKFNPIMLEID